MKRNNRPLRGLRQMAPVFCSIAVLSTQLQAGPTVQLNGDESRDNMADSGSLGYVGANTRIGVSVDRHLQGQVDINQIVHEDDSSATSAEAWFGYKVKDDDNGDKGFKGGGAKLNHQWTNGNPQTADTVHKVFGAYDRNDDDQAKVSVGYGQEYEDLFWSAQVSKGLGDDIVNGDITTRAYDYGVGAEVGTFFDSTLTRVRGGLDYEFGTDYADNEDRPTQATISAGIEQFFQDSPHSVTLDVSSNHSSGGSSDSNTDYNARVGYRYEFGGNGAFQSTTSARRQRVEIPGTPPRAGRAGVAAIPAIPAIAAQPARPAQAAIPAKYERRAVKTAGHEFVKTTMKLENETFFKLNSAVLTQSATRNLDKIVSQIRGHGYLGAVRITGNTCGMGDPVYDQRLSEKRANAVRAYLIEQGFNPEHLIARGLGKGSPKYDRNDQDFKNRRVDLEYVTERSIRQANGRKVEYKNVLVQEGRPATPAQAARPGRAGQAGRAAIPAIPASPGTASRFVWKTESVPSAPIWIKRALHNTIKHNKTVSTYSTRTEQKTTEDSNDSKLKTSPDFVRTPVGTPATIQVLHNDQTAGLTIKSAASTTDYGATVTFDETALIYTPSSTSNAGDSDSFKYTVIDSNGNEKEESVEVTITSINASLEVKDDNNKSTTYRTPVSINVSANDRNPNGDICVDSIVGNPSKGYVTIDGTGQSITYTPYNESTGEDSFTYRACGIGADGKTIGVSSDIATVTVTIGSKQLQLTPNFATIQFGDAPVPIRVLADDKDSTGKQGSESTLKLVGVKQPNHGVVVENRDDGLVTYEVTDPNFEGEDIFYYIAEDGSGHQDGEWVKVIVQKNNVPIITTIPPFTISYSETRQTSLNLEEYISDIDGDTLVIQGDALSGIIYPEGTTLKYTPTEVVATDIIDITVSDGRGGIAKSSFEINFN